MYKKSFFSSKFRNMLPVVLDLETSGLNPATDALLELAIVTLDTDGQRVVVGETFSYQIEAFSGAHIDPESLLINKIDPDQPLRYAIPELQVLQRVFRIIEPLLIKHQCQRALIVGHNAWFDLAFLQAAIKRCQIKHIPFHGFATLDTATLSTVMLFENVLARACKAANILFDVNQAHSAIYDAQKTAELFCYLTNTIYTVNQI